VLPGATIAHLTGLSGRRTVAEVASSSQQLLDLLSHAVWGNLDHNN
jgi:hypothetical protein